MILIYQVNSIKIIIDRCLMMDFGYLHLYIGIIMANKLEQRE